jgi:hypothetical protein
MRSGESRACSGDDASLLGERLDAIEITLTGRARSSGAGRDFLVEVANA